MTTPLDQRLLSIHQKVEQHLLQLERIGHSGGQIRR